jgi:hypothetical protein
VVPDDPPDDVVVPLEPLDELVAPLDDVVPLDEVVPSLLDPEDVVPLDDAVLPDDPKRPESLEPPHASAMLAPTKPQEARNQARRIR